MADVEQAQRVFIVIQFELLPDIRRQRRLIAKESLAVEAVMDGDHTVTCPLPQFLRESLARRDRAVCPAMERRARLPLIRVSSHKPYSRRWLRSRRKSAEV